MSCGLRLPPPVLDAYEWQDRALCRDAEVEVFFDFEGVRGRNLEAREEAAKAICRRCPVLQECLTHAMSAEDYGVWGGMTARERRDERNRRLLGSAAVS
ncbi:conserved hypothetical protein [Nostocoides japonicum T1-X7]|uniref:Transcriptional regulator WhiB n=1 Tax=Nostocoides japonicum T1-X7 TaxID=1194083 RepID=A0A077M5A9_9MICO|nr:WhiB family transcriptional regulator [Tetrasphaera japonica]CCH79339.1 conserved hypothetical protein [Tetrasphaera japonica T1-X7]